MNIRTPLFHLSVWRDGWVYFAILPDYKASGPESRNSPRAKFALERIPAEQGPRTLSLRSAMWLRVA